MKTYDNYIKQIAVLGRKTPLIFPVYMVFFIVVFLSDLQKQE